jgi:DNA-binding MarR family transcriptional regulator
MAVLRGSGQDTIARIINGSGIIYLKFIVAANVMIDASMTYTLENMGDHACPPGSALLLSRLAKQVYRRTDDQALGMHLRHLIALSYVNDHDSCPQQDLADAFCMDANNVVILLNELEELGYATRVRDPHDRRRHLVQITETGRKGLKQAERAQVELEDRLLQALDDDERRTLRELLRRALASVEPDDADCAYNATTASIST